MNAVLAAVLLVAIATSASAADPPTPTTRTATVFGDDPCPKATGDEIVVCGRLPESERFRIPKQFREGQRKDSGPSASWGSRVEVLEDAQRFTRPGSCTAIGSNGQSGCTEQMIRQWFRERQEMARARAAEGY